MDTKAGLLRRFKLASSNPYSLPLESPEKLKHQRSMLRDKGTSCPQTQMTLTHRQTKTGTSTCSHCPGKERSQRCKPWSAGLNPAVMSSTRHPRDLGQDVPQGGLEDHHNNKHQHLREVNVHRLSFQDHLSCIYFTFCNRTGSKVLKHGPFRTTYCLLL